MLGERENEGRRRKEIAGKKEKDKKSEIVTLMGGRGHKLKNGFSLTAGPHYVRLHLFPF